jgi:serine/threonine protein kinase/tetratricopeptide (TPR) repeat protein
MAQTNDTQQDEQLDAIVAAYLRLPEAERPRRQKELLAAHPELAAALHNFFDAQDGFRHLAEPLREVFTAHTHCPAGSVVGGYEILEEVARGGMGVVYRARSIALGRVVALKMLRAGALSADIDRQRFRTEAEAVAQLDFPNIVPVFEVGEDDLPYFSMKWMPGGSLAERLEDFRWPSPQAAGGPSGSARNARNTPVDGQRRRVLYLMTNVARAVHHAHTRGILHRDLKPANILLDNDDTPYVSDFGLLKRFGPADSRHRPGDTPTMSLQTVSGMIIGTPSYMAPEQASGKSGAVSVASDVYSLGAILYELLTGRPPFRGETTWDTLRQLQEKEPPQVRTLNAWVDRDLETVCHKCLHKDPLQRYASAAELTAELDRYGRGEPIMARPVSRGERCWRWCRRNPTLSAVSMLAVLALVTVAVGGVLFGLREASHAADMEEIVRQKGDALDAAEKERVTKERALEEKEGALVIARENSEAKEKALALAKQDRDAKEKAYLVAQQERQKADEYFKDANQAVYNFTHNISKVLANRPDLLPFRKELLQSALEYYKKFLKQRADDPSVIWELAEAYSQVGLIYNHLGSPKDALPALQKSAELIEKMHQAKPADVDMKWQLANSHLNVGAQQQELGKNKDALATYNKLLPLIRGFMKQHPQDDRFRRSLVSVTNNLAALHNQEGNLEKALELFQEVVLERKKMLAADPKSAVSRSALAVSTNNLGVVQMMLGKTKLAQKSFEEAIELRKELVRSDPKNSLWKFALAGSYRDLGKTHLLLNQTGEGIKSMEKAMELREQLAKLHTTIAFYQRDLAGSYQDFGSIHKSKKEYATAIKFYEKAVAIWDKLLAVDAGQPGYQSERARCDYFLAQIYELQNEPKRAAELYAQAFAVQEKLVQAHPQQIVYLSDLAHTLHDSAKILQRDGDLAGAEKNLRLAVHYQKDVLGRSPKVSSHRKNLDDYLTTLSDFLRAGGQADEALQVTLERRTLWLKNANGLYSVARDLAKAAQKLVDLKQRDQHQALAVATLEMAVAAGFRDAKRAQKEPYFLELRQRDDFRKLLEKLKSG